jgi:hypothetical protein
MTRSIFASLLSLIFLLPASAEQLTVAQFRRVLAGYVAAHKSDQAIAKKCEGIELTEQLSPSTRSAIANDLKLGPKTSLALQMLADISGFLDPPANEIPAKDAPAAGALNQMWQQAMSFAAVTMHHMPDLLATRVTSAFDNHPMLQSVSGWTPAESPLRLEGVTTQQITYRNGEEVAVTDDKQSAAGSADQASPTDLTTTGEFGPFLSMTLNDSLNGKVTWSHWEEVSGRLAAVYSFSVSEQASHYAVNFCWQMVTLEASYRSKVSANALTTDCYHGKPGYHGSIAIDPDDGAVMRITVEPDMPPSIALKRAAMSIQYGAEEIGGESYICPQAGVALSLVHYDPSAETAVRDVLHINETAFTGFRRFGATTRIILPDVPR